MERRESQYGRGWERSDERLHVIGLDEAVSRYDIRSGAAALWSLVEAANRYVAAARPWELAKGEADGDAGSDPKTVVCVSETPLGGS